MAVIGLGLGPGLELAGCKRSEEPPPGETAPVGSAVPVTAPDAAGGGADGDAAPMSTEIETMLARALAMTQALGELAEQHAEDCGALAAALEQLVVDNQPLFDDFTRHGEDPEMDRKTQAWMKAHAQDLDAAMKRARPALERCRGDARLKAVFDRVARVR